MRGSSGVRDAQGRLKWQLISPKQRDKNVDEGYYGLLNDVQSPPIKLRFFEFITLKNQPPGNTGTQGFYNPGIGEFMIFSKGSPAEVVLESDAIELPGLVVLGSVRWEAELPSGTDVEIRTRTGDQLLQHIRYFDSGGGEVTADKHKKLPGFRKGPVDTLVRNRAGLDSLEPALFAFGRPGDVPESAQIHAAPGKTGQQ